MLNKLARDNGKIPGGRASAVQGDVTEEPNCKRFVEAALKSYGRIGILQNNVGIGPGDGGQVLSRG